MAGFAVNIEFLLKHPLAQMPYKAGSEEDHFLRSLKLEYKDIEPKANLCTEVFFGSYILYNKFLTQYIY